MKSNLQYQIQTVEAAHINSSYNEDSFNEEEDDVIYLEPDSRGEHKSTSSTKAEKDTYTSSTEERLGICDEHLRLSTSNLASVPSTSSESKNVQVDPLDDIQAICEFWEYTQDYLDDEELQKLNKIAQQKIEHLKSPESNVLNSEEEHSCIELKTRERETVTSCSDCGLNCVHQLRACVNMIQVQPSLKKVQVKEIQGLKRTIKRKLQQQWIPCGVFDIKEQFKSNSVNVEHSCVKSYMPQWRKRKRRTPPTVDSHD